MSLEPAPSGSSRARRLVLVSHRAVNDHADLERIACGTPLYAIRTAADRSRAPIRHAADFASGGRSIVASHVGCSIEFCHDADILALAERAARVLPDIPLLGVDIPARRRQRSAPRGRGELARRLLGVLVEESDCDAADPRSPFESQFDAFAPARVLIEETRRRAC